MKDLFTKEIVDKYIRENFLRIKEILKDFDSDFSLFKAPSYTTNERDALRPKKGMIIYNDTTSKFQGYTGSAWVDFN